jgi:hypothetical protein
MNQSFHPAHWAERAIVYARGIASLALVETGADGLLEPHPGRGSATATEAKAADMVREQLARLEVEDVQVQSFRGLRSIWLFLAQAFGLALAGHAAFWLLSRPAGAAAALVVSISLFAASGWLLWRKFTFQGTPFRQQLPHGPSQNMLATLPPSGEAKRQVVLVAHLDSHRAVWVFANDWLARAYGMLAVPVTLYGVIAAPLLYLLASLTGWDILAYGGGLIAAAHFVGWMTGMTADLGPYSPGANDNAAAVGSVLALAERLRQQPLQHTEVRLAFTGCEETGCEGMLALLSEHGAALKDALWLDFELAGIGDRLAYLRREGVLRIRRVPKAMEVRLLDTASSTGYPLQGVDAGGTGVFTEAGALWEQGYTAACLVSLRQDSDLLPEWHRMSDTADKLEPAALERVHAFTWNWLQQIDQGH